MSGCKFADCETEATHTARICVDAGSTRGGFPRRDEDVPYCDPHTEVLSAMRFKVTPL